eukprot:TRINITY_DN6852_c0_g1_i1.p1 TRINITY_DN6852_c0_g1~~TRINITY_DN6852_c0_g1_i1.p1  ORF type:complete len:549 (-),score=163.46 TRINITY_DN6852_c0_g1_i1:219-1865(-)
MAGVGSASSLAMEDMSPAEQESLFDKHVIEVLFGTADHELDAEEEEYLASLTAMPLDSLQREPTRLADECEKISSDMEQLAYENYSCFVDSSECIGDVITQLHSVDRHLDEMDKALPRLAGVCRNFSDKAKGIAQERASNKIALSTHAQLVELLEVPQWMQTCVRNGFYEESLQLQAFVARLAKKFPDHPIVQGVVKDVESSTALMLSHLHQQLRTNVQLPACLRIIGFLRRLGLYSEAEMRVCFLQSRDLWLQSIVDSIPTANAYTFLNKLTDTSRAHLFDIITQYRAIFTDNPSASSPICDANMLHSWLVHRIQKYLDCLKAFLPRVTDGGSLSNLLDQAMYLGMSLGRVGADFRSLLPPIFEQHIVSMFATAVGGATSACIDALQQPLVHTESARGYRSMSRGDAHAPDQELLDFPPLAVLCNAYLGAFNELRQCAPLAVRERIARVMEDNIRTFTAAVVARSHQKSDELKSFAKMSATILIPYLIECLRHVYGGSTRLPSKDKAAAAEEKRVEASKGRGSSGAGTWVGLDGESLVAPLLVLYQQ